MPSFIGEIVKPTTPVTDDMVGRFLAWSLPEDFAPDNYISYTPPLGAAHPMGTNLLHAGQARAMLEYVVGSTAPDARPKQSATTAAPSVDPGNKQLTDQFEAEIVAKCLTAPRVTPSDIEANIFYETYFTAAQGAKEADGDPGHEAMELLTFCVLVLRNGHTVTGESYCADPVKFNADTGRIEARKVAIDKLWPMVVYAERERLAQGGAA